jgi:hypothetical protein
MRKCSTLLLLSLLLGPAALAPNPTKKLNRSTVGIVSEGGEVRLKFDFSAGPADQTYEIEAPAAASVYPVAGRWQEDRTESVGYYAPPDLFRLRTAQTDGPPTSTFNFFAAILPIPQGELVPIMGDWDGDGFDTAGIYHRDTGDVYLKSANATPGTIDTYSFPAAAGGYPVAGDWDGNGTDELGVWDGKTHQFLLFDNLPSSSYSIHTVPGLPGGATSWPIAGDWNFDGKDYVGIYLAAPLKTFYLLAASSPSAWSFVFQVSDAQGLPVAGSWAGESFRMTVPETLAGVHPSSFFHLSHAGGQDFDLYIIAPSALDPSSGEGVFVNHCSMSDLYSSSGWELTHSLEVLSHEGGASMGTVFSDPVPVFVSPYDLGVLYEKLAVYVVEHLEPVEPAGWVCLSYSHDGETWTPPIHARTTAGLPSVCNVNGLQGVEVLAEQVAGFRLGDDLYLGVMEGDTVALGQAAAAGLPATFTYLYKATISQPWRLEKRVELTESGMNTPNTNGNWVHNFGINLGFTLDPVEYAIYWLRSYPFPFALDGNIPCTTPTDCPSGRGLNPNRIQVYKLPLDPGTSVEDQLEQRLEQGPWIPYIDAGAPLGYPSSVPCRSTELSDPFQYPLGLDINAASFVTDQDGLIWRDRGGRRILVLAGAAVKHRMNGECDFGQGSLYLWREPSPISCFAAPCGWP